MNYEILTFIVFMHGLRGLAFPCKQKLQVVSFNVYEREVLLVVQVQTSICECLCEWMGECYALHNTHYNNNYAAEVHLLRATYCYAFSEQKKCFFYS